MFHEVIRALSVGDGRCIRLHVRKYPVDTLKVVPVRDRGFVKSVDKHCLEDPGSRPVTSLSLHKVYDFRPLHIRPTGT